MQEKLKRLQTNLGELRGLREEYSLDQIRRDRRKEWALRYGLLECMQLISKNCDHFDSGIHIISRLHVEILKFINQVCSALKACSSHCPASGGKSASTV